jgi:hypothetical protein
LDGLDEASSGDDCEETSEREPDDADSVVSEETKGFESAGGEARSDSLRRTAELMEDSSPDLRRLVRYNLNAVSDCRRGDEGSCNASEMKG